MSTEAIDGSELLEDPDARRLIYEGIRERAQDEAAGKGWTLTGSDPYADDWQMDLHWPARVSRRDAEGEWEEVNELNADVVSATLVLAKPDQRKGREGKLRAATLKRQSFDAEEVRGMREAVKWERLEEDFYGADPFAYGSQQAVRGLGGALGQYVPLWPGPVTRQLYWQDYWMMSAKSFEAYNHDPISWRMIHLKAEFALGKGILLQVSKTGGKGQGQTHDTAQKVFTEYWMRNEMDKRLDTIARDYCWGGEQFIRYFKKGPKITVRSLDPATIYDLITDPEDIETVFAYHQQYATAYQLYPPKAGTPPTGVTAPTGSSTPGAVTKYVIRQILPQEIDHYKANASAFERRGRSDLFPALGWIKRMRDYLTSHVIRADMLSRIAWDLKVAGNATAITALRSQLFPNGQPPRPGTVFGHNTASELQAIVPQQAGSSGSRGDPVLDALATMISLSGGVPKDWLGFGMTNTRAGALVATEPASKSLDQLQKLLEQIIHDGFDRAMGAVRITDAELEVTFPSISAEDRGDKLDDLGTMEAMGYLSKKTAGTIAGKEMGITTYDFEDEQALIAQEFPAAETEPSGSGLLGPDGKPVRKPKQGDGKIRRQVILATKRQAPKLDVTQSPTVEDEPPGLAVPLDGSAVPAPGSPDGTGRTVPGGGSHKDSPNPLSPSGAKDIRKEGTNLRQAEERIFVLTDAQLDWLLMRERSSAPRKRPDDPEYEARARRYREETATILHDLAENGGTSHGEPSGT